MPPATGTGLQASTAGASIIMPIFMVPHSYSTAIVPYMPQNDIGHDIGVPITEGAGEAQ